MASSKLMASPSASSRNSDLPRTSLTKPEFHNFCNHKDSANLDDGFLRNAYGGGAGEDESAAAPKAESTLLNAEITLLDAAGAIAPITDAAPSSPVRKKTVDEVWREIVAGKASEQRRPRIVECKEEAMDEMMTLEDFLVKAGAVEESAVAGAVDGEVKVEALSGAGPSGGMFGFENPYIARQGSVDSAVMGYGTNGSNGGGGREGRGKRRASSLLEPMDKAAAQRQRRMIKNRESAARSRERKQAYQVELESMAVKLEEENEQLLKEKAEWIKERCKMLMEKVIPVVEKRRPARFLRRVRSMEW